MNPVDVVVVETCPVLVHDQTTRNCSCTTTPKSGRQQPRRFNVNRIMQLTLDTEMINDENQYDRCNDDDAHHPYQHQLRRINNNYNNNDTVASQQKQQQQLVQKHKILSVVQSTQEEHDNGTTDTVVSTAGTPKRRTDSIFQREGISIGTNFLRLDGTTYTRNQYQSNNIQI
jgi:hypothetical protein